MNSDDVRFKIAAARRILYREGCDSQAAGQVTVRVPGQDAFWTTLVEEFDETLPHQVIKVDYDGKVLGGVVPERPISLAVEFHAGIFRERPDVNAIVHHHGHYAAVVASTGQKIGAYHVTAYPFAGDQAYIYDDDEGNTFDDKRVPYALGDKNVLLMKNHGCVVVAKTLEIATIKGVLLEIAARFHVDARPLGATELKNDAQVAEYQAMFDRYQYPAMWDSRVRRLKRSDPDLFEALD